MFPIIFDSCVHVWSSRIFQKRRSTSKLSVDNKWHSIQLLIIYYAHPRNLCTQDHAHIKLLKNAPSLVWIALLCSSYSPLEPQFNIEKVPLLNLNIGSAMYNKLFVPLNYYYYFQFNSTISIVINKNPCHSGFQLSVQGWRPFC